MKNPNILILMVDEERYPTIYEDEALKAWSLKNLKAQNFLKTHGFEFKNHYAASSACAPSRTSIYTGQYPSLHGVSQTPGSAKQDFDSDMYWLDYNTVPTFGDYLRIGGYNNFWRGKWHASQADIINPGPGHNPYPSYTEKGVPNPIAEERYLNANKLNGYGFDGWVGPEPFGRLPVNSGASSNNKINGRDIIFADEAIELIKTLDNKCEDTTPWCIVASFVNPHDITLYGEASKLSGDFDFSIDPSVPKVPRAPTSEEDLCTKPRCQSSYKQVYQEAFQPTIDSEEYRRLYYSLQLKADKQMLRVINALVNSSFYEDTIIIFTSDHGDMLGAHGGLFQKWYQAYEETIHVPLIIHNPKLFKKYNSTEIITSHIDILPTILSLANIDENKVLLELKKSHTDAIEPVGRDLTPIMFSKTIPERFYEGIYFTTDDNVTKGQNQVTLTGRTYKSVQQPSSIETVVTYIENCGNVHEKWKFSIYFNNSDLWTNPNKEDKNIDKTISDELYEVDIYSINKDDRYEQFELYNLTKDPLEIDNLINHYETDEDIKSMANRLYCILIEQRKNKKKYPLKI